MAKKIVDLNCDMGESFGNYKLGYDEEIIKYITSANIACGFHAGDPMVMAETVKLAHDHKVAIGAHPGFPDLIGFGRRNMSLSPGEVKNSLIYQMGALQAFAKLFGEKLHHVKPHGALYNMAVRDSVLALAIVEAILSLDKDLILYAPYGSQMVEVAREKGLRIYKEVFGDRAYNLDGTLVSRREKGALITDPKKVVNRVLRMVTEGKVTAIDGKDIPIEADTICIHGDTPGAVNLAKNIKRKLTEAGVEVSASLPKR